MTQEEAKFFITCWYEVADFEALVEHLRLDRRRVSNMAAALRRKGVALDPLPAKRPYAPTTKVGDWEALRRWSRACKAAKAMQEYRRQTNGGH